MTDSAPSAALNITRAEAIARAAAINVESYDIDLDLTSTGPTFRSSTTVRFQARPEAVGTTTFIDFVSDEVESVVLNGQPLDDDVADGTRITIGPLAEQNTLEVIGQARYMTTGEGLHRFVDPADGETYLYSQFEVPDSRRMFTVFEQPDMKATFAFTVTAPAHWAIISNQPTPEPSLLDPESTVGRWEFSPTPRISSYITALIAGPYHSVHSELTSTDGRTIPLGVYCRASLAEYLDAENIFTLTRQGFEYFENQFGTPYPFDKYDQLFVPEFNAGAMENAGAVTFLENYVFRSTVPQALVERRAITILHELAHMWFGNLVTMRWWNDLWLNESFAEFMSHLAAAENTSFTNAWTTFAAMEKAWAYRQDQLSTTHPVTADIRDLDDVLVNFDGITYAKGASVLRQLVAWVGQENFMAAIRTYFDRHAWGNTELPDLMGQLAESSGRDLAQWTQLWLETSGVNTLYTEVDTQDDNTITALRILQSAPGSAEPDSLTDSEVIQINAGDPVVRPHRIAVGFYDDDGHGALVRTHRWELDVTGASTEVDEAIGRRRPALIVINDDDLGYAKIRLDAESRATMQSRIGDVSDSLARTLLWGSAWDSTRDGFTPAVEFIDLVLGNIAGEQDSSVVQTLLRQVSTAVTAYVPQSTIAAVRADTALRLWSLVEAAEPGSDHQLQFFKAFTQHARGDQQERLRQIYSEEHQLTGLELNTDLRWEILTALVAGGRAGEDHISQAEAADPTATGALAAAQARAAIPTAEAKQRAWDAIISGQLSNTTQRHTIIGFNQVHDEELLAPFVHEYFDCIDQLWGDRSHEMAETVANGLYPAWSITPETIERTEALMRHTRFVGSERTLAEAGDDLRRAMHARLAG